MDDTGIRDTAAFRVVRQMLDHTWGPDEELGDEDLVSVCRDFRSRGGSWRSLLSGDYRDFQTLEDVLEAMMNDRSLSRVAQKVAFGPPSG